MGQRMCRRKLKNVRQVCYILLANSHVCGRVTGAVPLLTLQVAKFEAISLNRWQSHWGGQRHFHFCTFGAVCKDAWDRQHLTASYYKLLRNVMVGITRSKVILILGLPQTVQTKHRHVRQITSHTFLVELLNQHLPLYSLVILWEKSTSPH